MYFNSIQLIRFIGKDPERSLARGNGAVFTVLPVAAQRSWKNAEDERASKTEWHRVVAWNSLGEREYGKGKKATTVKHTVWQIRADSIRKLNRAEKEPEAVASGSDQTKELRPAPVQDAPC